MEDIGNSDLFAQNFANHFRLMVDVESALIVVHQNALAALDRLSET